MDTALPSMLDAALAYARRGWPVFPCDPQPDPPGTPPAKKRAKRPLVPAADKVAGKAVPRTGGFYRATTDEAQIRKWWRRTPRALIGVPTGTPIGAFVIDLDPDGEDVAETEARLVAAVGELPAGPRSRTQSGGLHIWFRIPAGEAETPKNSAKRLKNIDWRGDGGYVITPPSYMANGARYEWISPLDAIDLPAAPAALLDLVYQRGAFARELRQGARAADPAATPSPAAQLNAEDPGARAVRSYVRAALDRAARDVAGATKGTRGFTLNREAFGMAPYVALGVLSEREVTASLQDAADASGLTAEDGDRERDAKIRRGLDAGAGNTAAASARLDEIAAEARRKAGRRRPPPASSPADYGLSDDRVGRVENAPLARQRQEEGAGAASNPETDSPDELLQRCAAEPETDVGNGRRLLHRFGTRIIHVANIGWHGYDGRRWKEDDDGSVVRPLAQRTAELITDEARLVTASEDELDAIGKGKQADAELKALGSPKRDWPPDRFTEFVRLSDLVEKGTDIAKTVNGRKSSRHSHAKSSAGTTKINNMLTEAAPHVACSVDRLNTDLHALNVGNGTLRFVRIEDEESDPDDPRFTWTVRLDPHDPNDFISKLVPFDWRPGEVRPELDAFLEKVQPEPDMRAFLKRLAGYIALGIIDEQVMAIFHGGGRNGKSTFVALLCHVLGDYAVTLDVESFTGENRRSGAEATPDLARLPGARLVASEEPDEGVRLKEGLIKRVTGGTMIPVRRLHKDFIEVMPQFTPVLSCNPRPEIRDMSEGLWRRILLVPWEIQIAKAEVDRKLSVRLRAEAVGVLAWIVEGALEYLNFGLAPPPKVLAATAEYRADSDHIGSFIRSACIVTGKADDTALPASLFIAYQNWQARSGAFEFQRNTFFKRFPAYAQQYFEAPDGKQRQFSKDKSGTTIYRGILIRPEFLTPGPGSRGDDE